MGTMVLAGYLTLEDLRSIFNKLARAGAFLILEGLTDLKIEQFGKQEISGAQSIDPALYEEGRMFDENFELRWQKLRGYPAHILPYRVMLVSDSVDLLKDVEQNQWQSMSTGPAAARALEYKSSDTFYLWGEAVRNSNGHLTGEWYEKEVPRLFRYPVECDEETRVKVEIKAYKLVQDKQSNYDSGQPDLILHRFSAILPAQE
jgi:hypothetical protein